MGDSNGLRVDKGSSRVRGKMFYDYDYDGEIYGYQVMSSYRPPRSNAPATPQLPHALRCPFC